MAEYTITLSSSVPNAEDAVLTTVRVDTGGGTPKIVEVTIRPGDGSGLTPDLFPAVDLKLLVRAFLPEREFLAALSTESAPVAVTRRRETKRQPAPPSPFESAEEDGAENTGEAGSGTEVVTAAAATTGAKNGTRPESVRPYRRMPEVATVLAALEEAGSVSAMATQLGVPVHTAKDWMRRIRKQGLR